MTGEPPHECDALWTRTRDALGRERGLRARLRSTRTPVRIGIVLVTTALVLGLIAAARVRPDLDAVPPRLFAAGLAVLAAGLLASAVLLLRPLYRHPLRTGALGTVAWIAFVLPAVLVVAAPLHQAVGAHPESFEGTGADFWPRALACFLFGCALGLPVLLVLLLVERRANLGWSRILLLAAAMGLVGNLVLTLHCPLVSAGHLLAGHATVPLGALAILAAGRLVRRGVRPARGMQGPVRE
jgi:hypothetical protein